MGKIMLILYRMFDNRPIVVCVSVYDKHSDVYYCKVDRLYLRESAEKRTTLIKRGKATASGIQRHKELLIDVFFRILLRYYKRRGNICQIKSSEDLQVKNKM